MLLILLILVFIIFVTLLIVMAVKCKTVVDDSLISYFSIILYDQPSIEIGETVIVGNNS